MYGLYLTLVKNKDHFIFAFAIFKLYSESSGDGSIVDIKFLEISYANKSKSWFSEKFQNSTEGITNSTYTGVKLK